MTNINLSLHRRSVLKGAAGLSFLIGAGGLLAACGKGGEDAAVATRAIDPNIWVTLASDGKITIRFAGTELGQGSMTSVPLILAEEMDADWSQVTVETVMKHDVAYGNPLFGNFLYTAGSGTMEGYYPALRKAGAQARRLLIDAAASKWQVPASELATEPSVVVHQPSGRKLSYGEIAGFIGLPAEMPEIAEADYKARDAYRYVGTDIPRLDIPEKVVGKAVYGMDIQIPGMVYASVLRAPVEGEAALAIDDAATRAVEGVIDVVTLEDGVAVVAERYEAAIAGREALKVTWSDNSPFRAVDSEQDVADHIAAARDLSKPGSIWREAGDVEAAWKTAARSLDAIYSSDYVYHAQMEPMNCTALVNEAGDGAEIWVGTQTQSLVILGAAQALGTTPDKIKLNLTYVGGGFGRRSPLRQRYVDHALFTSKAVKRPVKVIWTREDDLKYGAYRPISGQYLKAAMDKDGNVTAWQHRVAAPSVINYINPFRAKASAGMDIVTMNGAENSRYEIANLKVEHVLMERRARIAPWRGVGAGYTKFAGECFVDELAAAAKVDPLEFRLRMAGSNPRSRRMLEEVAAMAKWGEKRDGTALGIGLAGYKTSSAACIAEVSVDRATGVIKVHKIWAVADPGMVVSPGNTVVQVEGNLIWGVSAALRELITIKGGETQQSNFYDYEVMRMADMPEIEVKLMESGGIPTGVGELGLPMIAPAIANGFATLTGKRLRRLPMTPDRVLAALNA